MISNELIFLKFSLGFLNQYGELNVYIYVCVLFFSFSSQRPIEMTGGSNL